MSNIKPDLSTAQLYCFHCGDICATTSIKLQDKNFCCKGCKTVYEILNNNGLCTYYDINEHPGTSQKIEVRKDKFAFLEDEQIVQKLISYQDENQIHITFYLPQIHCSSCLWLLENLHTINESILTSKVDFEKKEVFVVLQKEQTSVRKVAELLTGIGYEPYISFDTMNKSKVSGYNKSRLYKIGVAGFAFGNIMLLSFPEYFSISGEDIGEYKWIFRGLNLVLALPVFFYSATEFFATAWGGIKNKYLNIDVPIALAIIITFFRSIYELYTNTGPGYFDSMTGIVLFMLTGRILQDRTYQSLSFDRDYKSFFPITVNVIKEDKAIPITLDNLKYGDVFEVFSNELIPVDAILTKGNAQIDYSFVTGESIPVQKQIGEIIYAGGKQIQGKIELMVVKEVTQSYLTNLWNKSAFKESDLPKDSYVDFIGKYFTWVVFAIAAIACAYWMFAHDYTRAFNVLTTILIVACPCALLLSSTFTNGNIIRILGFNKFYVRHASVVEELGKVNHIVLDKTGTITQNQSLRVVYEGMALNNEQKEIIKSVTVHSNHPLSKAVVDYFKEVELLDVKDFKALQGKGITAWVNEQFVKIGSSDFVLNQPSKAENSEVHLLIDNNYLGKFAIHNAYRFGLDNLITSLKDMHYDLSLISGDNAGEESTLRTRFGKNTDLLFHQLPEDKLNYVAHLQLTEHKRVAMLGDGLNDSGALKQSNVGIAVTENTNNFTPASDAILQAENFILLPKFFAFAKDAKRIILTSFIISIMYNIIGLYFAVRGALSPLIAAILMPCSSIFIILFTFSMSYIFAWKRSLLKYDKNHVSA